LNFDLIAGFYDRLAKVVFGKQWDFVQKAPVKFLENKRKVLIVGGGTGELLENLMDQDVTYLEISERMIQQAKKRNIAAKVEFVTGDYLLWNSNKRFDAVVMPFFLDCFKEERLQRAINRTKEFLVPGGELIITDFQHTVWWKNVLVKLMYLFFRLTSQLEGDRLLDFEARILKDGFELKTREEYLGGWVFCGEYKRITAQD